MIKRISDGIVSSKLTPYENLLQAIIDQAVHDIKDDNWNDSPKSVACRTREGLEAVDFIVLVLKQNAYSKDSIAKIFREITPHNYKYDIIKERLAKGGIEL
jgi:hypothetical protein